MKQKIFKMGTKSVCSYIVAIVLTILITNINVNAASSVTGDRDWKWPVPSSKNISSCFPNYCGHSSIHHAIDISANHGSAIYASYSGTVLYTNNSCNEDYGKSNGICTCGKGGSCLGKSVYILHNYKGGQYVSRYGHMASINVSNGQTVDKNTIIGTVGSTGASTGYHLDFTIWVGNSTSKPSSESGWVDPFLNQFLEKVDGLTHVGCNDSYVDDVNRLYQTPINNNIVSSLDKVEAGTGTVRVAGWVFNNEDYSSYVSVHTYIGGPAGASNTEGFARTANQYRSDVETVHGNVGKYHGFDYTFATSKTGTQEVYVYGINTKGRAAKLLGHKTVTIPKDTTKPTVSNVKISDVTTTGYTVTCNVSDNVSIAQVKFPTWTATNGQDDIIWGVGTVKDGVATYRVNRSDHNNEKGQYVTDVYAYDKAGNESDGGRAIYTFENKGPTIDNIEVEILNNRYVITCDVSDDSGISKVLFPTWTVYGDQDDLDPNWGQSNSQSIGSYNKTTGKATFTVKYADHNNEYGLYVTDIYAYDSLGNVSGGRKHVDISPEVFYVTETTYNGHRYVLYDGSQSWTKAKSYCESKGGHLVTITSDAENNAVLNLAKKGSKGSYLIGAESVGTKGTWRWVTGETFSYSNWDKEGPEGNTEGEPYAGLIAIDNPPNKQSGEWVDEPDAYKVQGFYHYSNGGFICEYESDEPEHTHTVVIDPAVEPTCNSVGYTEGSHCSECGETIEEQEILPMTEHVWETDYATVDVPTCEEDGYEEIICSVCGAVKEGSGRAIEKLGHEYGEWTNKDELNHQRICKNNPSHIETENHKWDNGTVTKPATETQEGTKTYTCTVCEATIEESIPVLSHTHQLSRVLAKQATCTEDGNMEYWKCDSCGKIFSDSTCTIELKAGDVINPATGHKTVIKNAKSETCTGDGYSGDEVCTVCGDTVVKGYTIPATGHIAVVDPGFTPTCQSTGLTEGSHCSVCGETIVKQEVLPKSEHNWNSWYTTVKEPTCDEDGYEVLNCSLCGTEKEGSGRTLTKLDHDYGAWLKKDETTHKHECYRCNHEETENHKWDAGTVTKAATETEEGIMTYKCTVCEATKTESIPPLSHTHSLRKTAEKAATCKEDGNIEYWTCESCGKIFSDSKCSSELRTEDIIVPTTGHKTEIKNVKDATCTVDGYSGDEICKVCGETVKKGSVVPATGHNTEIRNVKNAACIEDGYSGDEVCKVCGETVKKGSIIPATGHTVVTDPAVEPTTTATGLTEGSHCSVCGTVIKAQEVIPKKAEGEDQKEEPKEDVTPSTPSDPDHPDVEEQEKAITTQEGDGDPKGSTYIVLSARVKKSAKTSNTLAWSKVSGASGYIIYGNKCGTAYHFEKLVEVKGTSYTHKGLKKGTYYKYLVVAYKEASGRRTVLATSKAMHAATTGGKVGNCKKLNLNKTSVTIKKKKTFKIKAKEVAASKKMKIKRHRKIAYESSNPKIATVTSSGKIKGIKKGSCKIYVYAQNGVYKVVKVKVK